MSREGWGTGTQGVLVPASTPWPPPCRLGTEEWYPSENVPCVTIASSPTSSTATLTPSPHTAEDAPHLRDLQSPRLPR